MTVRDAAESALPPGTWPKASDEGYFKNLISGGRKHSWECSALPSSGGRGHSCECKRPLGCYTRPPNSTLSLPFPGMTNTLYTIGPLIKVADSEDCGQVFRLIADTDSDRSRTAFR